MANNSTLTPAVRAANFAATTRQNFHQIPSQSTSQAGTTLQFTYPKARLLSKTFIKVDAVVKITHASVTTIPNIPTFGAYKILRRISLSLNNGFEPFSVTGQDLAIMNLIRQEPQTIIPAASGTLASPAAFTASSGGTNNTISFVLELENTLNQRDASSLILLQNESSSVTLSIDIASDLGDIIGNQSGYTYALQSCTINPCIETYTIPATGDAFPDLSILKLVKSKTEQYPSGEKQIKLDVGTIYRKLILYLTDSSNVPLELSAITSKIEMKFNTADTPISIDPAILHAKNTSDFGYEMPKGVLIFDFSGYSGFANYGGSRDFIDSEKLTEFWLILSTSGTVNVTVIAENLSRLHA